MSTVCVRYSRLVVKLNGSQIPDFCELTWSMHLVFALQIGQVHLIHMRSSNLGERSCSRVLYRREPSSQSVSSKDLLSMYRIDVRSGNETFECPIVSHKRFVRFDLNEGYLLQPSRASARFFVKIYDWYDITFSMLIRISWCSRDAVGKPDKLGMAQIDLSTLEPFTATPLTVQLQGTSEHKASGEVSLRLVFRPEVRSRFLCASTCP